MKIFQGDNPTELYLEALETLEAEGDTLAPRGKEIKEIRPAVFEFTNPVNRVTFVKGRRINPFFQLAESLWILSGRSDVAWLTKFNKNMASFSDDGVSFNAPYGERLRTWNQSRFNQFIFNPIDQLHDVYNKIAADNDTRQAVALIYNPVFDNHRYSSNGGKDTPCNLVLTFKVRQGKLDLTVYNRSNDLHWGVFGANLVQFTTIQEVMASWLGVKLGTYRQITDSLHIYTKDYGAKCTEDIKECYIGALSEEKQYVPDFDSEPSFSKGKETFEKDMYYYWSLLDPAIMNDEVLKKQDARNSIDSSLQNFEDSYMKLTVQAMYIYRLYKLGIYPAAIDQLSSMDNGQWKVACAKFMKKKIYKEGYEDMFERLVIGTLDEDSARYVTNDSI